MFYHYDDPEFKKIIDNFILSSSINGDKTLSYAIKNIDLEAAKKGISFYQMMFILIQKNSFENNRRKKKWLKKDFM